MTSGPGVAEDGWVDVGAADELARAGAALVRAGGRRVVVARRGADWVAFDDACPHAGDPLHLGVAAPGAVICRAHGWKFDVVSGRCLAGDPAARLPVHPVQVAGGRVRVRVGGAGATS